MAFPDHSSVITVVVILRQWSVVCEAVRVTYTKTVRREPKEKLERPKGEKDWSGFLSESVDEVIKGKREGPSRGSGS